MIFSDPNGRIIIKIKSQGEKVIIAGVYAPNEKKSIFFKNLEKKLLDYLEKSKILLLGDFNGVINPLIDRTGENKGQGNLPPSFVNLVKNLDLKDS